MYGKVQVRISGWTMLFIILCPPVGAVLLWWDIHEAKQKKKIVYQRCERCGGLFGVGGHGPGFCVDRRKESQAQYSDRR